LTEAQITIPIIFLTGQGDISMSVQAMKAGASDFLTKPIPPFSGIVVQPYHCPQCRYVEFYVAGEVGSN
jgi:PleD family two-component response regulator